MADYISKEEAINAIKNLESSMPAKDNYAKGYDAALGRVLIAVRGVPPTADVQPVRRGKWDFQGYQLFKCTNCTKIYTQEQLEDIGENWTFPNFCPNCGASMDKS